MSWKSMKMVYAMTAPPSTQHLAEAFNEAMNYLNWWLAGAWWHGLILIILIAWMMIVILSPLVTPSPDVRKIVREELEDLTRSGLTGYSHYEPDRPSDEGRGCH